MSTVTPPPPAGASPSTLLVDDDRGFASLAAAAFTREGMPTTVARSLFEARKAIQKAAPDLVILDRQLPDGDGLTLLEELRSDLPGTTVVMVTAHGDIASAVEAIRLGAADYVAKPVELPDLMLRARRAAEGVRLKDRLSLAEAEVSSRSRFIPPRSEKMTLVVETLGRIARSPRSAVLLLGETGVGKEVLARLLHEQGPNKDAPFVHLNCAALPEATVESELFGHERGAFTDAKTARRGLVEVAHGGTLFLDEVGELSLAVQAKLLTFLDKGEFRRLGATQSAMSTARIVAATNRDLEKEVREGRFREDLWFRLGVFRIQIPPLRERHEDVLQLAEGLLVTLGNEIGRKGATLTDEARARLSSYAFPGNVRELRNVLERALVLEPRNALELDLLPEAMPPEPPTPVAAAPVGGAAPFHVEGGPISLRELERRYTRHVLEQLGGRRMEAAKALGLSYPTFLKRLQEG